ncbi:MAG: CotH kinase family protein [Candidatus Sericytochromatia bacterium]
MPTRLALALAATLALTACQAPAGTPTGLGAPTAPGGTVAADPNHTDLSTPAAFAAPAKATVLALAVTTRPKPGGPTMADVDADKDPKDAVEPEVDVEVRDGAYQAVGVIKARGHSTREADQMSYSIKLAKDAAPWQGYKTVMLNKHPYDLTRVRNKLAFDLLAYVPELAASKTQFVHLTVDGTDMGLFTQVEKVDKDFLKAHGLDPAGHLYKAEEFEFLRYPEALKAEGAGFDKAAFERVLEIEGAKDHGPLLAMLDAVNAEDQPIDQVLRTHFDRRNFVTWLALNVLMGNQDTTSQNFLLYRPTNGRFHFLPWDYDASMGFYNQPDQVAGNEHIQRWQEGLTNWWASALVRRYLQAPGAGAELDARIRELANGALAPERIRALVDSYRDAVAPHIAKAPDVTHLPASGEPAAAWRTELDRITGSVTRNLARYESTRLRPMPVYLGDVEVATRLFSWDASFSLTGHPLIYDLQVARTPDFAAGAIVAEKKGLTTTSATVEPLAPGTYYYRVTVRDTTDPTNLFQWPFDRHDANGRRYDGVRTVTIP